MHQGGQRFRRVLPKVANFAPKVAKPGLPKVGDLGGLRGYKRKRTPSWSPADAIPP
jgi:hypothetical protein